MVSFNSFVCANVDSTAYFAKLVGRTRPGEISHRIRESATLWFFRDDFPVLPNADRGTVHLRGFLRAARGCWHGAFDGLKKSDVLRIGVQLFHGPCSISCGLPSEHCKPSRRPQSVRIVAGNSTTTPPQSSHDVAFENIVSALLNAESDPAESNRKGVMEHVRFVHINLSCSITNV